MVAPNPRPFQLHITGLEGLEKSINGIASTLDPTQDGFAKAVTKQGSEIDDKVTTVSNNLNFGFDAVKAQVKDGFNTVDGKVNGIANELDEVKTNLNAFQTCADKKLDQILLILKGKRTKSA